ILGSLPALPSVAAAVEPLRENIRQPAKVGRGRRLALLLGCCFPCVFLLFFIVGSGIVMPVWQKNHPDIMPLFESFHLLELQQMFPAYSPEEKRERPQNVQA